MLHMTFDIELGLGWGCWAVMEWQGRGRLCAASHFDNADITYANYLRLGKPQGMARDQMLLPWGPHTGAEEAPVVPLTAEKWHSRHLWRIKPFFKFQRFNYSTVQYMEF